MKSHGNDVLVYACMCELQGAVRAIWLASSVESEHWNPAALCPSFQSLVSALAAAWCAAEAWNRQVTLPLHPWCTCMQKSQWRSQLAIVIPRCVFLVIHVIAKWVIRKFKILSAFLTSTDWVKIIKNNSINHSKSLLFLLTVVLTLPLSVTELASEPGVPFRCEKCSTKSYLAVIKHLNFHTFTQTHTDFLSRLSLRRLQNFVRQVTWFLMYSSF